MKVTDYIAGFLSQQGVTHVFELSGGMITHILDSLYEQKKIKIITMHHEQGAAFAADAFARITGVPGIALATSGPGATNLLTGIGSCYFDSVPAVFITGQVNQHEQKGNKQIRQLGFQETDIATMAVPVTKAVFRVERAEDVPTILAEAFRIALSGRPGPVLIDLPMNLQRGEISVSPEAFKVVADSLGSDDLNVSFWNNFYKDLNRSDKPLILVGRGVLCDKAQHQLIKWAESLNIPVVTSLMALDAIPYEHPLRVGFIGSYGNRWANLALGESDFLVVLGSRLDIRQTGADTKGFRGVKKIYHVDIEPAEINNRIHDCIAVEQRVGVFIQEALKQKALIAEVTGHPEWHMKIQALRLQWPDTKELVGLKGINPNKFMHELSLTSSLAKGYIADVGSHQMWAAQSLELKKDQFFLTSGGMGAMGFALPAAIGACIASGNKPVVMIAGDGGFQLNIQELQTIVRNKLPVKLVVINNRSLGMIRQFQDSYFDSRHQSTVWGYSVPDFEKVAKAYSIDAITIAEEAEISGGLEKLWMDNSSPFLLQVMVDSSANAYPKIAFGRPITEMEPLSKPIDIEST